MAEQILNEYEQRVVNLMEVLIKTESANHEQTRELFNLHNEKFKPRETGVQCNSCRARVFRKMKDYYNTLITNAK